ncbi:MAG: hypothetical protein H0U57_10065 [Tatlockia sp.]|nr:hypothetical protein [Tatlockia sp.]
MLKNIAIFILSLLLSPLTAIASAILIVLVLAVFALVSPYAALGSALYLAGILSEKLIGWIYRDELANTTVNQNSRVTVSTIFQGLFILLAYIPSAIGIALATLVIAPLAFFSLTAVSAFIASQFLVDKIGESSVPEYTLIPERDLAHEEEVESLNMEEVSSSTTWQIKRPPGFLDLSVYSKTFPFFKPEDIQIDTVKEHLSDSEDSKPELNPSLK